MVIRPPDLAAHAAATERQQQLTKPAGALGRLEELACWFAARQGRAVPARLVPAISVFAADHGVAGAGVSAYPSQVTALMVENFARGGAAINVLARHIGATISVVDVGVDADLSLVPGIVHAKLRRGSRDLSRGAALTRDEVDAAIAIGAARARADVEAGANLLIAGEMGIGNTTPAACLICALTGEPASDIVGRGTGIDDEARARKVAIVANAIERARGRDAHGQLCEVGGLEIAAIVGYQLGAATAGVPVLLDGFIATAAALVTRAIDERAVAWMLASHRSAERGHQRALARLGLEPLVDLEMRLGEGSGAALVVPILDAAVRLHAEMATFAEAGIARAP